MGRPARHRSTRRPATVAAAITDQRRGYARAVLQGLARTYRGRPAAQVQKVLAQALGPLGVRLSATALRELADAAVIARCLAGLTACLPEIVATLKTAVDHAGTPVEVDGCFEALHAAHDLVAHTHRMAHNLDPHYGPHGRHPHRRGR